MHIRVKRGISVLVIIVIGSAALFIGRGYLLNRLKKTLEDKIMSLNKSDLNIKYDTLYINWRKNIITAEGLVVEKDAYDTTCIYPEFISAQKVTVEGFDFITYLFKKKVEIDKINIVEPHIVFRENSQLLLDSASKKDNEATLNISNITISKAHVEYTDSASCQLLSEWNTTINSSDIQLLIRPNEPINYTIAGLVFDNSSIHVQNSFYTFQVKQTKLDMNKKILTVDTVRIVPDFSKAIFGQKKGYEVDRFEGVIPFIDISGLDIQYIDTFAISAKKADIQLFLKVYRDKQLPDKAKYTHLPIEALHKLPFGLKIDTLEVVKSYISYEEASSDAPNGVTIFFDDIRAFLTDVNNDKDAEDGKTILNATAKLMGQGTLEVHSVMPWKKHSNYLTRGELRNISMNKFNKMLEPLANVKVETGELEALTFKFYYNNLRSDGEIGLEYKDLKLTSLRDDEEIKKIIEKNKWTKQDPKDLKKNPFKSFLLNTFIIKRNMDENDPEEKRTGTILFYRNTSKSIFNYMWKSIFSGVKSAYNLDKLAAKQQVKKDKKTKRQDKRKKRT